MKRTEIATLVSVALLFLAVFIVKLAPSDDNSDRSGRQVGDTVTGFGCYNGSPIEWTILDIEDDSMLLISTESIDIKSYDPDHAPVTWETSFIREWLNGVFINEAFTEEEQGKILTSLVTADPNPEYDTDPGSDTEDKIFLLSIEEVREYYRDDVSRQCLYHGLDENYWWWLRSPGRSPSYAARVRSDGTVDCLGYMVENRHAGSGVRPVMRVSVS